MQLFKSNRTDILKRGMSPDAVIEAFDILKDRLPGLGTCLEASEVNTFTFEGSEERFHRGIVPAVALAAHTHRHAHLGEQCLIGMTGVLASAVRVMQ
jgi:hypothetical protein